MKMQGWPARLIRGTVAALLIGVCGPVFADAAKPADTGAVGQVDGTGALLPRVAPDTTTEVKPKAAKAEENQTALDYTAWNRMADRAEQAIGDASISSTSAEHMRVLLVDWRAAFSDAQSANSARIATLRTQITALGPAPAEGVTEAAEIATRRAELTDQLVKLQAPGIAADEAYQRADGLIREIDKLLRVRQADQLLQLWPMPINPANWPDGFRAMTQVAVGLYSETHMRWKSPEARRSLADNLPMVLALLALAAGILWRGRQWIDQLTYRLQNRASARGRRIWAFLASLGQFVVPMLGVVLIAAALQLTGMLGSLSKAIVVNLPGAGALFFGATWLGGRVFPVGLRAEAPLRLSTEQRAQGRILSSSFGLLMAIESLRGVVMDQIDASPAAIAVISFPIIVLSGLLLLRMGQFMRRHVASETADEEGKPYSTKVISLLGRGAIAVGVLSVLLAAVGYVAAAQAMVFPAIMSLALLGLLSVLNHLIAEICALVMRRETSEGREGLVPVLAGFILTLATIPLFALIWGARLSDLTELWTRFREGFQMGDTRISPTVFLFFAVVFGIGYTLTRLFQGALRTSILPRTALDQGGQNAIVSGVGYVGIFLAALIGINAAGIDLTGLALVASALSVGIGFGLQTIVSNFVSGVILLIERPVSEGDWIEVGTTQGIVKSISVRSTRIQTFDRSDVIVPNSDLITGRVTNWTRFNMSGRITVPLAVPFTSDSRRVEAILREIAEAQPLAILNPAPIIALMSFGPEVMNFEIRLILRDINFQVQVRSEINQQIAERFKAEGIVFSNQHRDYLKRIADEAAAEAEALAEEQAHLDAVAAFLAADPAPKTSRRSPAEKEPNS